MEAAERWALQSLPASPLVLPIRVAELLEGKGAGKRGRYQGKATRMSQREAVRALLWESISQGSSEQ